MVISSLFISSGLRCKDTGHANMLPTLLLLKNAIQMLYNVTLNAISGEKQHDMCHEIEHH